MTIAGELAMAAHHREETWSPLAELVAADGTRAHAYPARLLADGVSPRDLADTANHLCLLHARFPGLIDHAAGRTVHDGARAWLVNALDAFAIERAYLTRLVVAAGPIPSTPNHAESDAAMVTQRHTLDMLAQSERGGCAIGAALALALDWIVVRGVLDAASRRFGVEAPPCGLPPALETAIVASMVGETAASERAMLFGAQQLCAQHRGLWDLLEARAEARG